MAITFIDSLIFSLNLKQFVSDIYQDCMLLWKVTNRDFLSTVTHIETHLLHWYTCIMIYLYNGMPMDIPTVLACSCQNYKSCYSGVYISNVNTATSLVTV